MFLLSFHWKSKLFSHYSIIESELAEFQKYHKSWYFQPIVGWQSKLSYMIAKWNWYRIDYTKFREICRLFRIGWGTSFDAHNNPSTSSFHPYTRHLLYKICKYRLQKLKEELTFSNFIFNFITKKWQFNKVILTKPQKKWKIFKLFNVY